MSNGGAHPARGLRLLAGLAVALTLATALQTPVLATSSEEARFVSLTNASRANNGQGAYAIAYDLVSIARRHSAEMAKAHTIYHNSRLGSEVSNWRAVGENVGVGDNVDQLHQALMNSASHRANILDRDFTQIGVGVAHDERGRLYVTEVFRQPMTVAAPVVRPVRIQRPVHHVALRQLPPPAPDQRAILVRKLGTARAIVAKARPVTSVDHARTYVVVMVALL